MPDVTIMDISDIEPYSGPHALPGIRYRAARQALGVEAWGMNVIELDPHCVDYPEHNHVADGQEEVYVILDGSATVHLADARRELHRGQMMRVAPSQVRKFTTSEDAVTLLIIGGTPGAAYAPGS